MSPTERGLWAAVLADPGDDLPRLIYADYLEENGRAPLANFIRAQITLSQCPLGHPNYADAVEAQSLAVAAARGASSLPAPTLPDGATFTGSIREIESDNYGSYERGFASRVTFSGLRMRTGPGKLAHALWRVTSETPIRELQLVHIPRDGLAELLACPAATELTGLAVGNVPFDSAEWPQLLAESPHLSQLRRFAISANPAPPPRGSLHGTLAEWDSLDMQREPITAPRHTPTDWSAVAAAPWFAPISRWCFSQQWLFTQLRGALGPAVNSLTVHAFEAGYTHLFTPSFDRLSGLKHLSLPGTSLYGLNATVVAQLAFPPLASLQLSEFDGNQNALPQLLAAPYLGELTELAVTGARANPVRALPAVETFRRSLRLLYLDNAVLNANALAELATPGLFPMLTTLSVKRQNAPNDGALARFADAWHGETLHTLILDGWPAPAAALQKLAANPAFKSLRRLKLAKCGVSDAGGVSLARSPHLQNLVELDVSYNTLGEKSAALFLDNSVMPNLVLADLTTNRMYPDTRTRLRASRVGMWA